MNFKYVIALVLVLAVVTMAAKIDKKARKAAKKAKKESKMQDKLCKPFKYSYTQCSGGMMTVTRTSDKEGCEQQGPETVECVKNMTKPMKKDKDCSKVLTIDRTPCGEGDITTATYTKTKMWSGCKTKNNQPKTFTFSCETGKRAGGRKRGKGKKGGKGKRKNNRRAKSQIQ